MKSFKTAVVFLLVAGILPAGATAGKGGGGGGGEGNGGDGCAAEFVAIGRNLARMLPELGVTAVDQGAFHAAIDETTVRATDDNLFVDGQKVQAKNFPARKLIEVSRNVCDPLATPAVSKVMIVFHEYLGIMGLEKSGDYRISSTIVQLMKKGKLELAVSMPRPGSENGLCFPVAVLLSENRFRLDGHDAALVNNLRHAAYIRNISDGVDYDYLLAGGSLDDCRMAVEVVRKNPRKIVMEGIIKAAAAGESNASSGIKTAMVNIAYREGRDVKELEWLKVPGEETAPFLSIIALAAYIGNPLTVKTLLDANWYEKSYLADSNSKADPLYGAVKGAMDGLNRQDPLLYARHLKNMKLFARAGIAAGSAQIVRLVEDAGESRLCGQRAFWNLLTYPENKYSAGKMARYAVRCDVYSGDGARLFAQMLSRMPKQEAASALDLMWVAAKNESERDGIKKYGYKPGLATALQAMAASIADPGNAGKYDAFKNAVIEAYDGVSWNTAIRNSCTVRGWCDDDEYVIGGIKSPSPLMYALYKGDNWLLGRMLASKEADLGRMFSVVTGRREVYDLSALEYALYRSNLDAAKMLMARGAGFARGRSHRLVAALNNGNSGSGLPFLLVDQASLAALVFALDNGAQVTGFKKNDCRNACYIPGEEKTTEMSLLFYAIWRGRQDMALELLRRGADANSGYDTLESMKPLHLAVINNMPALVEKLAVGGASLNVWDSDRGGRFTPLMYAARAGDMAMAKLLLRLGADSKLATATEYSCRLYYVSRYVGCPETETASDIARKSGHKKLARFLKRAEKRAGKK